MAARLAQSPAAGAAISHVRASAGGAWRSRAGIALLLALSLLPGAAMAQDFTIQEFRSEVTVHQDSAFDVTESITVRFSRKRHGIYREIPYKYTDEVGGTLRTPIEVLSVSDEAGNPRKYKVSKRGSIVNIRIGDPDKYVSGKQTYVIKYRVQNAILFLDDHDELYWNVTGDYWKAPIEEASASVTLQAGAKGGELKTVCFTGRRGSTETACSMDAGDNSCDYRTTRRLGPGEGFTIGFGWPKGLVTPPAAWKKLLWAINLSENWVFLLPLASLLFMLNSWHKRGRDPRVREAVAVAYGPPKHRDRELSAAELGAVVDEKLDPRDITAAIVGLAVKGYIRIEENVEEGWIFNSTDYTLKKLKEPDEGLCSFEKTLMARVFTGDSPHVSTSDLKNKFYKNLNPLKGALYGDLVAKGYFGRSPDQVRRLYLTAGIVVAVGLTLALALLIAPGSVAGLVAGLLTGVPVAALARFMPAKTAAGALARSQILGFEEFLNRAEKDRLERIGDKELFSRFLPYAIALDVADNWAKAFEGICQEPPQWYASSRPGMITAFNPRSFSGSIGAMTSSLATAMFSAPRSSGGSGGFSGGGSSGGGFGGGGGGSW